MPQDVVAALAHFMNGQEWQESIETFVKANCHKFLVVETHDHEHFRIWKNFQDIVESILASALDDIGSSSLSDFEKALEKLCNEPSKGPREATRKEILAQLLTYENFQSFSEMMHIASQFHLPEDADADCGKRDDNLEIDARGDRGPKTSVHRKYLLELGFKPQAVDYAIERAHDGASVDVLIDEMDRFEVCAFVFCC
jgi:hypothetical protein